MSIFLTCRLLQLVRSTAGIGPGGPKAWALSGCWDWGPHGPLHLGERAARGRVCGCWKVIAPGGLLCHARGVLVSRRQPLGSSRAHPWLLLLCLILEAGSLPGPQGLRKEEDLLRPKHGKARSRLCTPQRDAVPSTGTASGPAHLSPPSPPPPTPRTLLLLCPGPAFVLVLPSQVTLRLGMEEVSLPPGEAQLCKSGGWVRHGGSCCPGGGSWTCSLLLEGADHTGRSELVLAWPCPVLALSPCV